MNKKVAIIGNGWVGKAMQELFPESVIYVRDITKAPQKEVLEHKFTNVKTIVNLCDIAFICVPTPNLPMHKDEGTGVYQLSSGNQYSQSEGKLDTSAVEECIAWCECPLIVIRSTVNPGDCDTWVIKYNKNIVMQPEYLGETPSHPMLDQTSREFLIIGGSMLNRRKLVELYQTTYNAYVSIRLVSLYEAEVIKLTENRAIAFKVAQCQELYDACQRQGNIDYYTIRDAVYGDDPRFNLWWTFIYPEKRGFNSKCIPKDIYAWCAWAESLGYEPKITRAILEKNKEWISEQ